MESGFGRQRTLSGGNTTSLRPGGCERASMGSVGEVKEVLKWKQARKEESGTDYFIP